MTFDELPIRWMPDVCPCVIRQCRTNPDNKYLFERKCDSHKDLSDVEARQAIVTLCIQKSEELEKGE